MAWGIGIPTGTGLEHWDPERNGLGCWDPDGNRLGALESGWETARRIGIPMEMAWGVGIPMGTGWRAPERGCPGPLAQSGVPAAGSPPSRGLVGVPLASGHAPTQHCRPLLVRQRPSGWQTQARQSQHHTVCPPAGRRREGDAAMPASGKVVGVVGRAGATGTGAAVPARLRPRAPAPNPALPGGPALSGGSCWGKAPRSHHSPQSRVTDCEDFPLIN